jgi:hypothetical protein
MPGRCSAAAPQPPGRSGRPIRPVRQCRGQPRWMHISGQLLSDLGLAAPSPRPAMPLWPPVVSLEAQSDQFEPHPRPGCYPQQRQQARPSSHPDAPPTRRLTEARLGVLTCLIRYGSPLTKIEWPFDRGAGVALLDFGVGQDLSVHGSASPRGPAGIVDQRSIGAHAGPVSPSVSSSLAKSGVGGWSGVPAAIG